MTCGQVLDLIPFYWSGYLQWTAELDSILSACIFLA